MIYFDFMNRNNTLHTLTHWYSFRMQLIVQGIGIGLVAGLLIVLYRFALEKAGHFVVFVYTRIHADHVLLVPWILVLLVAGLAIGKMVKKNPMISGSGIPQVEGFLLGKLEMNWWRVILWKFLGGLLSIGSGLSLGREGPSVQLGAAVGQGFSTVFKRKKVEGKYLVTGGASAGLAAAFNAPLAGVMFALEEVHKNFSPMVLITALSSALTAGFVSSLFFGLKPVFNFGNIVFLPLKYYFFILLLGIVTGVLGMIFNTFLLKFQKWYSDRKWLPGQYRILLPLFVSVFLGLALPQVLGGGHELINELITHNFSITFLLALFLLKLFFTLLCYGSGAPGGIFLPLLAIGALIGNLYGLTLVQFFNIDSDYAKNFIILAMAGYFTAIVRAPITGIILITEMTGSFSHLLSVSLVCIVSYVVADFLSSKPIYESLLNRLLSGHVGICNPEHKNHKTVLEFAVCQGSCLDGKQVREICWPASSLLVSVTRGKTELIPHGDTCILAGDYVVLLTNESEVSTVNSELLRMIKSCEDH